MTTEIKQDQGIKSTRRNCRIIVMTLFILVGLTISVNAIDIQATGNPVVTGSGANMTALWSNVAEVDGQSVDLFAEIISHTGAESYVMVTEDGDFKFQFIDGTAGENRSATLRWTFYLSGTNTPATIPSLAFTIDDLDDQSRHESLSTNDAYDYTVNDPTELAHSMTGGTVTASGAGGIAHNSGDPKAAVKLLFTEKSSIVITYNTEFDGATASAFHHDGNGDFVFDSPPVQLYYTYDLTNNEEDEYSVDFINTLPDGLIFDTEYIEVTGTLTGSPLSFSNGNQTVSANNIVIHPGTNTIKLRTLETSMSGEIENVATMDPKSPYKDPIVQTTTITLP